MVRAINLDDSTLHKAFGSGLSRKNEERNSQKC